MNNIEYTLSETFVAPNNAKCTPWEFKKTGFGPTLQEAKADAEDKMNRDGIRWFLIRVRGWVRK